MKLLIVGKEECQKDSLRKILTEKYGWANTDCIASDPEKVSTQFQEDPDEVFIILYMEARSKDKDQIADEPNAFARFEQSLEDGSYATKNCSSYLRWSDTDAADLGELTEILDGRKLLHANLERIVMDLKPHGTFKLDEDGRILLFYQDGRVEALTEKLFANALITDSSKEGLLRVMEEWLSLPETAERII